MTACSQLACEPQYWSDVTYERHGCHEETPYLTSGAVKANSNTSDRPQPIRLFRTNQSIQVDSIPMCYEPFINASIRG